MPVPASTAEVPRSLPCGRPGVRAPLVGGVGEPTLTADGAWLYFVAVFKIKGGEFDADVARVWRT